MLSLNSNSPPYVSENYYVDYCCSQSLSLFSTFSLSEKLLSEKLFVKRDLGSQFWEVEFWSSVNRRDHRCNNRGDDHSSNTVKISKFFHHRKCVVVVVVVGR